MTSDALLALLQFSDGLFPAGTYAHSCGLETFVQEAIVSDADGVEQFLRAYLQGAVARTDASAVILAMRAVASDDLSTCQKLDAILEAMKPVTELRAASRQLGRQTLRIVAALEAGPLIREFLDLTEADVTPCHHAVAFGMAGAAFDWPLVNAAASFLYTTAAGLTGSALRLLPLGQTRAQIILRNVAPLISSLADIATKVGIDDLSSFAPAIEIAAMKHERLEARLFRS